jgi:hypothetical protein
MCCSAFRAIISRANFLRLALMIACVGSACGLQACSIIDLELNNRGGFVDAKLDERWFIADTKQMRVLRGYVLIGSLARMPADRYSTSERDAIVQSISSAVLVANDAFTCAYARPGDCVYFDERMAELEIAILRLAVAVFTKKENEDLFSVFGDQIGDTFPLLKGLDSLSKIVDAFSSSAELVANTGKVISSLLKIGQAGYGYGRRIGSLYRDSIELNMVAALASLKYQCQWTRSGTYSGVGGSDRDRYARQFYGQIPEGLEPCATYEDGFAIWHRGAGNLGLWVNFLYGPLAEYRSVIIPDTNTFVQASDLVWRACEQITDDPEKIAKCIGRRPKNNECGCRLDTSGSGKADDCRVLMYSSSQPALRKEIDIAHAPREYCPLISFAETWDRRNDRYSTSSARLDGLSFNTVYFGETVPE